VLGAVKYLQSRGIKRIALVGFSLGGMVAILSAAICPDVAVVIDDGGPVRMRSALKGWAIEQHLPAWSAPILAWLTIVTTSLRLGANLFAYEPLGWVGKIAPRPLMLIHGDRDQYVTDFDDLMKAAQPTEIWRLPGEGHVTASQTYPEEYRRRIIAFLTKYL
jgi:uncharacterized protein